MPNNQLIRTHDTIDYDAGNSTTIELPRSHFYERLNLLLDYDVTFSGSTGSVKGLGIADLIENVSVQFNGNKTPKSTSFGLSHFIDWYQYGTRPVWSQVDPTTASQQTGSVQTFVDFLIHPGQYGAMLPSFEFSDLTLTINWATPDAVTDTPGELTVNSASVAVQSKERKKKSVPTPNRPMSAILDALSGFKETERSRQLTSSGPTAIDLPKGNTYYGIPFLVIDDEDPSNSLVSQVKVEEDGVSVHKDSTFDLLRAEDKQQYGIENRPDGFAYINYGIHGNLDDVVPTANMDAFELTVDTGQTSPTDVAEVRYVTQEIVR